MCLIAYNQQPKIATDDIPIFKYLFYDNFNHIWRTPYTLTEVPRNGILIGEFADKFSELYYKNRLGCKNRSFLLQIDSGFIHAFTTTFVRESYFLLYQSNGRYRSLIRGYIPKGTQYHISIDGSEICAKKIILTFD